MSKPRSIIVGGMKFKILWNVDSELMKKNKCLGMCKFDERAIWISGKLAEETKRHIFLHEVYHAIWYVYWFNPRLNIRYIEEDVVSFMAPAFLQVMDDNPKAREYLFGEQ